MTQNQCQSCSARATLALCNRCIEELKADLLALARGPKVNGKPTDGLLDALADVELKQTKLGNGGGHRKKGDDLPIPYLPDTGKMVKDKKTGEDTDVPILSPQGKAAMLLDRARNTLSTIVRDLCESRGIDVMRAFRVVPQDFSGPLLPGWRRTPRTWAPTSAEMAAWLAGAVHAIACDEGAGVWRADVDSLVRAIQRAVDRPTRRVWLGDCPTWNEQARTVCGVSLWAPEDAVEVWCYRCRSTHDCNRLKLLQYSDLEREKVPWEKILRANKSQPLDRQIPERTLQSWRRPGKDGQPPRLKIRGYRRPDGRTVINRHSDEDVPLYLWPDVRKLRDEKPQKRPTGAGAHRRKAQGHR